MDATYERTQMSYQDERERILRMRLDKENGRLSTTFDGAYAESIPVPPTQYSEVEQYMARQYEDEALLGSGLIPGVIHDRRGVWEGLDARNVAHRQVGVGLYRANGFNRGNTMTGESIANNPVGADDNVRVYDKNPVPQGEHYTRPFSMMYDRIGHESGLIMTEMSYPFFAEYRNSGTIAAGAVFSLPGSGVSPTLFNHDKPIEKIVVINDSAVNLILAVDMPAANTPGAPGTGNGQFMIKPGESNTYPVRCYQSINILNTHGSTAIPVADLRVQVYGYKDSHPNVLLRTGRPDVGSPVGQDFSSILP